MKRFIQPVAERRRSGATLVEFAVVAPIFFMLLFGGIEFAVLGTIRSTAQNAAYEAARKLVIPGADVDDGIDEARRIMSIVGVDSLTVTTNPNVITDETQEVTVDISIPYDNNAIFVPYFTGGIVVRASSTLKTERYGGIASTP
jgi:Flp pilus assembly protein TadG